MARQIPLDLTLPPAMTRADFVVTQANALALRMIEDWRGWPEGRLMLLGPAGSGKTHLARIWAQASEARIVAGPMLAEVQPDRLVTPAGALAIEDAEAVAGHPARERALFHLHNHLLAQGGRLLITAARPVAHWGVALPDLLSRLQAMPLARLEAPDEALMTAVLVKLFADRQITAEPGVIVYLTRRIERSLAMARQIVAQLDQMALAESRPVTRALAVRLLAETVPGNAPGALHRENRPSVATRPGAGGPVTPPHAGQAEGTGGTGAQGKKPATAHPDAGPVPPSGNAGPGPGHPDPAALQTAPATAPRTAPPAGAGTRADERDTPHEDGLDKGGDPSA